MTSKIRRTVLAGTIVASTLVVGGIGTAWAQSDSTATPSQSQRDSSDPSTSHSRADCPLEDTSSGDATSSATSA